MVEDTVYSRQVSHEIFDIVWTATDHLAAVLIELLY
jgi:hypothetical protein